MLLLWLGFGLKFQLGLGMELGLVFFFELGLGLEIQLGLDLGLVLGLTLTHAIWRQLAAVGALQRPEKNAVNFSPIDFNGIRVQFS